MYARKQYHLLATLNLASNERREVGALWLQLIPGPEMYDFLVSTMYQNGRLQYDVLLQFTPTFCSVIDNCNCY